uniref:Uncharacterized protein n=1 Tax=viral metagenome TaxID=1070528 RepID=A0A6M3LWQ6_9ZZZZ
MAMTRHFVDVMIQQRGWQPYIKSHWMIFGKKSRAGVIITFKDHEQHEYSCSMKTATSILTGSK